MGAACQSECSSSSNKLFTGAVCLSAISYRSNNRNNAGSCSVWGANIFCQRCGFPGKRDSEILYDFLFRRTLQLAWFANCFLLGGSNKKKRKYRDVSLRISFDGQINSRLLVAIWLPLATKKPAMARQHCHALADDAKMASEKHSV